MTSRLCVFGSFLKVLSKVGNDFVLMVYHLGKVCTNGWGYWDLVWGSKNGCNFFWVLFEVPPECAIEN